MVVINTIKSQSAIENFYALKIDSLFTYVKYSNDLQEFAVFFEKSNDFNKKSTSASNEVNLDFGYLEKHFKDFAIKSQQRQNEVVNNFIEIEKIYKKQSFMEEELSQVTTLFRDIHQYTSEKFDPLSKKYNSLFQLYEKIKLDQEFVRLSLIADNYYPAGKYYITMINGDYYHCARAVKYIVPIGRVEIIYHPILEAVIKSYYCKESKDAYPKEYERFVTSLTKKRQIADSLYALLTSYLTSEKLINPMAKFDFLTEITYSDVHNVYKSLKSKIEKFQDELSMFNGTSKLSQLGTQNNLLKSKYFEAFTFLYREFSKSLTGNYFNSAFKHLVILNLLDRCQTNKDIKYSIKNFSSEFKQQLINNAEPLLNSSNNFIVWDFISYNEKCLQNDYDVEMNLSYLRISDFHNNQFIFEVEFTDTTFQNICISGNLPTDLDIKSTHPKFEDLEKLIMLVKNLITIEDINGFHFLLKDASSSVALYEIKINEKVIWGSIVKEYILEKVQISSQNKIKLPLDKLIVLIKKS